MNKSQQGERVKVFACPTDVFPIIESLVLVAFNLASIYILPPFSIVFVLGRLSARCR